MCACIHIVYVGCFHRHMSIHESSQVTLRGWTDPWRSGAKRVSFSRYLVCCYIVLSQQLGAKLDGWAYVMLLKQYSKVFLLFASIRARWRAFTSVSKTGKRQKPPAFGCAWKCALTETSSGGGWASAQQLKVVCCFSLLAKRDESVKDVRPQTTNQTDTKRWNSEGQ